MGSDIQQWVSGRIACRNYSLSQFAFATEQASFWEANHLTILQIPNLPLCNQNIQTELAIALYKTMFLANSITRTYLSPKYV
jgi:hypothetical protein